MDWNPPQPGELFEGKYRIDAVLGVGGFAHVYRATQIELGRPVALKVLKPFASTSSSDTEGAEAIWVKRFQREARLVAQLRDPHTITMYEYGRTAQGMSYMAFEFVSGNSLDVVLKQEGPLAPHRVATILSQALESLAEAHQYGVLHRDIKPANILLYEHMGKADRVKVLDFGIAKPLAEAGDLTSADLTQAGMLVGTPRYMAPEQLMGESIGPACDIYSMGLVAFELLTGTKAAAGSTTMTIIAHQLGPQNFTLPTELNIPIGLRSIIQGMLAKDLATRLNSASQIVAHLQYWDAEHPLVALPQSPAPADHTPEPAPLTPEPAPHAPANENSPALAAPDSPSDTGAPPPARRRGIAAPLIAILVMLIAIGASIFALTSSPASSVETAPQPAPSVETAPQPEVARAPELTFEVESAPEVAPEPAVQPPLQIDTSPAGLALFLDGRPLGDAPLSLPVEDLNLPQTLSARHPDGREVSTELVDLSEPVHLTLPEPEARPEPPRRAATTPSKPAPRRADPAPTPKSEPGPAPEPEPAPHKSAEPSFPALDTLY
ncbi:hypothetical protein DL240_07525 [Lujinxingia litoralis]|uniref:Protein kinase domain-containing protein n=1 Tax=Lujinxingia litoralis TaxID=2211119 RepID=A0A328C7W3_9DELT|nr:serine/threonine-protein kinase [Lujinxingia litoralis]RAL22740.1 hypothetical protein DL240_07525 [Lujinxingia litoralis]